MRHVSTTRVDRSAIILKLRKKTGFAPLTTIAVVGNINLDVKTSRIAATPGIMADGETSIQDIHESIGGGGANTAVAAAIMGPGSISAAALGAMSWASGWFAT